MDKQMQERIEALDYDYCLQPGGTRTLPDGSVLMFSPDGSGKVHFYQNPLIDRTVTISDDADLGNKIQLNVTVTAYGISIALLNKDGQDIAEISADFFENRLNVIAANPADYGQNPTVKQCLIEDVRQAIQQPV